MNEETGCRRRRFTLAIAGALFLGSGFARAEPVQQSPTRLSNEGRAEQLFRAGEKKFDAGQHSEACLDFAASLKLGPKLGTLLNLALCHETVGRIATAWHEFHHAAAWATQNNQKDRVEFANQHIRSLEPRLPRIIFQLPADRAISELDLDGEPLPEQAWYLPLYLDPGEHRLGVSAPGKKRATISFRVISSPTDQLVSVPTLEDDPGRGTPAPNSTASGARPSSTLRTMGFIMLGGGVIGLTVGTILGIAAMGADEGDSAVKDYAMGSTFSFIAGAGLAGAGGYLVLTNMPQDTRVMLGPRPGGLSVVGTF